jgi:hypothetical protein
MFRFAYLLLLIGAIATSFPQDAASTDPERDKDVYTIYSLLLTNPKTSHGSDDNERYLIAPTTIPGYPSIPCVRPPKERNGDFAEVWAEYQRRKTIPTELKPMFSIPKQYVLLTDDEVKGFIDERGIRRSQKPPDERFRGVSDLFRLTDVYFNPRRTLALTAISTYCGGTCGMAEWKVFEKLDGKWEPLQWVVCSSIS